MLDPFDYKEPSCALCGGEEFYNPDPNRPDGRIPVERVIARLDECFNRNALSEAERLLDYWLGEARSLKDKDGELTVLSEQMGLYRKLKKREPGLQSVRDGLAVLRELGLSETVSGATVELNAATTMKAFGQAAQSLPLYDHVRALYDTHLPPHDPRRAGLNNNMALAYADMGRYADAEKNYLDAIAILEAAGNNENDIAVTYVNLAHLYEVMFADDCEKAEACIEKALEILDSPVIPHNGYHAYVCEKCAPSVGYFGYFADRARLEARAKELYERAGTC